MAYSVYLIINWFFATRLENGDRVRLSRPVGGNEHRDTRPGYYHNLRMLPICKAGPITLCLLLHFYRDFSTEENELVVFQTIRRTNNTISRSSDQARLGYRCAFDLVRPKRLHPFTPEKVTENEDSLGSKLIPGSVIVPLDHVALPAEMERRGEWAEWGNCHRWTKEVLNR